MAFKFAGTVYGGITAEPIVKKFQAGASGDFIKGQLVTLAASNGTVTKSVTADTKILGSVAATKKMALARSGGTPGTLISVIVNQDAVYATSKLDGATGAAVEPGVEYPINSNSDGLAAQAAGPLETAWRSGEGQDVPIYVRIKPDNTPLGSA